MLRPLGYGVGNIGADSDREIARYDALGPLCRAAISDSPRIIDIAKCLRAFRQAAEPDREGFCRQADLKTPEGDAEFAVWIKKMIASTGGHPFDYFVLRPRRVLRAARFR